MPPSADASARALALPASGVTTNDSIFAKPLVLAALVAVALAAFLAPGTQLADVVLRLRLPDNDDAMRLVEVRDLLAGQGWFDIIQHRYLPPLGASMHWSRFVDAPIALLISALTPMLGRALAEGVVAATWPPLLFLVYLALVFTATRRFFGSRTAAFAVFAACQTGALIGLFQYGRIDHHNVQILAVLGIALGMADPRGSWLPAILAGTLAAFSLAVGLETLPFVACGGVFFVARWILEGRGAERPFAGFAIALAVAAPILFGLQTAPHLWGAPECDALSAPWLLLSSGAGALGLVAIVLGPSLSSPTHRAAAALVAGIVLVAAFALLFPLCLQGPFVGMPEIVRTEWLATVQEARPFVEHLMQEPRLALAFFAPLPIAAVLASYRAIAETEPRARRSFAVFAVFLWPGVIISLFLIRGAYIASAFVPFVGGWALDRGVALLSRPGTAAPRRIFAVLIGLLLISKTWFVLALAAEKVIRFGAAPAPTNERSVGTRWAACTDPDSLRSLDRLIPGIVLTHIDLGPNVLLHTHHAIIAAPYHRNVDGLLAEIEAFAGSEAEARRQAELHHADYVVICPRWLSSEKSRDAFLSKLSAGEAEAAWLSPLPMQDGGALKAWRVRKP
jgi:hypothetical protein